MAAVILLLPVFFGVDSHQMDTVWITVPLVIVLWLIVIGMMSRQYVQTFRKGLKERSVDAAVPINVSDVTTLEVAGRVAG